MTRASIMKREKYLGDGLYAACDGFSIILSCDRESGEHYVALEPDVLSVLIEYAKQIGWTHD